MKTEERIQKQRELVEQLGRHYEQEGLQPIAARILGLLMVMDKEQYTFDEIVEDLQISKSSASNALRLLEIRDLIEYVTHPGDRKRYFKIKTHDTFRSIEEFEKKLRDNKLLLSKLVDLKADKNSENTRFFKSLLDLLDFALDNFERLRDDYMNR